MKSALYRYPHPEDPTRFIYVGQVWDTNRLQIRNEEHQSGLRGFGFRFKKKYPNVNLPSPICEFVEVFDQLELNELETIWMFRFHTWRGYPDGENLTLPGAIDYKDIAYLGGVVSGRLFVESGNASIFGKKWGQRSVENGQLARMRTPEHQREAASARGRKNVQTGHIQALGREYGRKNKESGFIQNLGHTQGLINKEKGLGIFAPGYDRDTGGRVSRCLRWRIRRGKTCICGKHLGEAK